MSPREEATTEAQARPDANDHGFTSPNFKISVNVDQNVKT